MQDLWTRLEAYLRSEAPDVLGTLLPPANEAEITAAQRTLGVIFPADLVASLKIHNGQREDIGDPSTPAIPLVPEECDRNGESLATWGELAPLNLMISSTQLVQSLGDMLRQWGENAFDIRGPIRRDGKWSFVSFSDPGSADRLAVDLNPGKGGTAGQVVSIPHDPPGLIFLASSYREWFELLVERYEAGRYYFAEQDGGLTALDRWNPIV